MKTVDPRVMYIKSSTFREYMKIFPLVAQPHNLYKYERPCLKGHAYQLPTFGQNWPTTFRGNVENVKSQRTTDDDRQLVRKVRLM